MTDEKDDWRAVDWPKKQVDRINRAINELNQAIGIADDDLNEVFEDGGLLALHNDVTRRLSKLERRLRKPQRGPSEPFEEWVEHQLDKLRDRVDVHGDFINRSAVKTDQITSFVKNQEVLAGELNRLSAGVASLSEQGNTDRETLNSILANYVHEAGFEDLITRVQRLEQGNVFGRLKGIEDELKRMDSTMAPSCITPELLDRISNLEVSLVKVMNALTAYGIPLHHSAFVTPVKNEWPGGGVVQVEDVRARDVEAPMEFSSPVGGRNHTEADEAYMADFNEARPQFSQETKDRITGASVMRQEAYDRGYTNGKSTALGEASARVLDLMRGSFSEGTIRDVVKAINGE